MYKSTAYTRTHHRRTLLSFERAGTRETIPRERGNKSGKRVFFNGAVFRVGRESVMKTGRVFFTAAIPGWSRFVPGSRILANVSTREFKHIFGNVTLKKCMVFFFLITMVGSKTADRGVGIDLPRGKVSTVKLLIKAWKMPVNLFIFS